MKKRLRVLAVILMTFLFGGLFAAGSSASAASASNALPYYIMVNRKTNTVTVYTQDEAGHYTVPYKAMICSTGRQGHATPLGSFTITSVKKDWCLMLDGTYGQYSTQFYGNYLFHSICYTSPDPSALIASEYNMLGGVASLGCVRLQTIDAKWIYDNCAPGTRVTIYESDDPGPLGKPERMVDVVPDDCGWDPTDPRPENPWTKKLVEEIQLSAETLEMTAGSGQTLTAVCLPEDAGIRTAVWKSDNPDVASVQNGRVIALREGTATITATCGLASTSCAVTVTGELLPFSDLTPGAWYYDDMRFAKSQSILNGTGQGRMEPDGMVTWAAAIQLVYNLAGRPEVEQADAAEEADAPDSADTAAEEDAVLTTQTHWYDAALCWAEANELLAQMTFDADVPVGREAMVTLLYRCAQAEPKALADFDGLNIFADAQSVSDYAAEAVLWAAQNAILKGDAKQQINPQSPLTRAQAAALFRRYIQSQSSADKH